ncbi:Acyl-CoA-binding domain-containing protein 4 [Acropora cervicornis]|uniref:Acyl-CoA-binding domain-containing protein 4 n=1 Tax=Acropora cervicornis TaxID=6130 RepID=A0AAD9QYI1_ACRCE|nr:Acyl-CoA-binding domain-containing protein 4 [Acropora cervicornis]
MSTPTCSWVTRGVSGQIPAPRQGHAAAVVDKKVYIFGGSSGGGYGGQHSDTTSDPVYLNDLFLLQVGLQVTWERLQQLGDIPCPRDGHTLSAVGSVLYLFGGTNYPESEECLEGLYAYDIGTVSWELCPTQGRQPRVLGHSTAVVGDTLYIFGGIYHGEAKNDLYMLNTGNLTWTPLRASGKPPSPRCDHASAVVGERFYILGGSGGQKLWYNDLHFFDTVTLRWENVSVSGHLPHARSLHTISAHHSKDIYLFGGSNDKAIKVTTPFDDIQKLSLSKLKWKKLICGGTQPERRLGHTAVFVYGQLVIFGGMNDQKDFNDVNILQTRAALKHLPPEMTGIGTSPSSLSRDGFGTLSAYDLSIPVPAPYRPIMPALTEPAKPQYFESVKASFVTRVEELFEDISIKFAELETQKESLKNSVEAFQNEKKAHIELYEKQQKELAAMIDKHRNENEKWIADCREELKEERRQLEQEKRQLVEDREKLRKEREEFNEKIEAIERLGSRANHLMNGSQ